MKIFKLARKFYVRDRKCAIFIVDASRAKIRGRIFSNPERMMQRDIWIYIFQIS